MTCPRLQVLNAGFAIGLSRVTACFIRIDPDLAAAKAMEHTLEPLDEKLSKYIRGNPIRIVWSHYIHFGGIL